MPKSTFEEVAAELVALNPDAGITMQAVSREKQPGGGGMFGGVFGGGDALKPEKMVRVDPDDASRVCPP